MTEIMTTDLSEFGEAAVFIRQAAEAVFEAEQTIGNELWKAGQALTFAFAKCPKGRWSQACVAMGIRETRALQYRHVYERFNDPATLPDLPAQLLIEISAPNVPLHVVESIVEAAAVGDAPSVREAQQEIRDAKAQAPAAVDHDVDRTRQEPQIEGDELDPKKAWRLVVSVRTATQRALDAGVRRAVLRDMLASLSDEVMSADELVGLDDATLKAVLR